MLKKINAGPPLIMEHPRTGNEILKSIAFSHPVAETVLQHHEKLDGSGYPRGVRGGERVLEARIIAVADVLKSSGSPASAGDPDATAGPAGCGRADAGIDHAAGSSCLTFSTNFRASAAFGCKGSLARMPRPSVRS